MTKVAFIIYIGDRKWQVADDNRSFVGGVISSGILGFCWIIYLKSPRRVAKAIFKEESKKQFRCRHFMPHNRNYTFTKVIPAGLFKGVR